MVEDEEEREPFQLSLAQVAASSLAAVSAAVVCSFFGVAGTVIGTAIASTVATIGGALYSYSLRRTKARLRRLHRVGAAAPPVREVLRTMRLQSREILARVRWGAIGVGTGTVFVFSIGVITLIEGSAGEPLSALLGAPHSGNGRTSISSLAGTHHRNHSPSPTPTATTTSSPSPSPSRSTPSATTPSPPSTSPTSTPSSQPTPTLPVPILPGLGGPPPTAQSSGSPSPGSG